jgi:LDH2 family malate/lactate/ureidoglycolate dehydrogenase
MTVRVPTAQLHEFVTAAFERCGLDADAALTAADAVCYADVHGFTTHGSNALAGIYVPRLRDGRISAHARPQVISDTGAVAVIDGRGGLGLLAMTAATDLAADKAVANGVGLVAVRGSTHFGSAGFYTHRLAERGLIGLAMTNCGAQGVAPPLGGRVRLLGTNPLSAAVPAAQRAPFVLDMSTTVVATGKLQAAKLAGQQVPAGWLYALDGTEVTDPDRYYRGTADVAWLGGQLATGGAKGFGLALLVDLLCGPLAGAAFGPHRRVLDGGEPIADTDIGHVALAINPTAFGSAEHFTAGVEELLGTVEACPPAVPGGRVTYPGAPEAQRAAESAIDGVALPTAVADRLRLLGADLGLELPTGLAAPATVGRESAA